MHYTPLKHNVFKVYNDYKYKFPISSGAEATLMYRLDKKHFGRNRILFSKTDILIFILTGQIGLNYLFL